MDEKVHDKVYQTDLPSFWVMFDSRDSTLQTKLQVFMFHICII